jgi:transcriptional regulator with XRE-family HTH domain
MDAALLSKIERGQRLPTPEQTVALAKYFSVEATKWEGMRMAEKFLSDNGHNPAAAALAAARIKESAGEYLVKRTPATTNKARKR